MDSIFPKDEKKVKSLIIYFYKYKREELGNHSRNFNVMS